MRAYEGGSPSSCRNQETCPERGPFTKKGPLCFQSALIDSPTLDNGRSGPNAFSASAPACPRHPGTSPGTPGWTRTPTSVRPSL
jgi:hypothetical protein